MRIAARWLFSFACLPADAALSLSAIARVVGAALASRSGKLLEVEDRRARPSAAQRTGLLSARTSAMWIRRAGGPRRDRGAARSSG